MIVKKLYDLKVVFSKSPIEEQIADIEKLIRDVEIANENTDHKNNI